MKRSLSKYLTGFVIGVVSVGGYAVANTNNVPMAAVPKGEVQLILAQRGLMLKVLLN